MFMVTGADFNVNETAADYNSISSYQIYGLQVFRNSLGDISIPGYQYWIAREEDSPIFSTSYIEIIWLLVFLNALMMLIVLLNFLIAIVSESYARVNA